MARLWNILYSSFKSDPLLLKKNFKWDLCRNFCEKNNITTGDKIRNEAIFQTKKINLAMFIPITSFALGCWQLYRLNWKHNLINNITDKMDDNPKDFPFNSTNLDKEIYGHYNLVGNFDYENEFFVGPCTCNFCSHVEPGISKTEPSFHVITPFYIDGVGKFILVDRGWVTTSNVNTSTNKYTMNERDKLTISGYLLRQKPASGPAHRQLAGFSQLGFYVFHVDSMTTDALSNKKTGPYGSKPKVFVRNEHLNYAITWFSLCAATLLFQKYGNKSFRKKQI